MASNPNYDRLTPSEKMTMGRLQREAAGGPKVVQDPQRALRPLTDFARTLPAGDGVRRDIEALAQRFGK